MEAVTAILRNNLKNTTTAIVVGAILGLLLGLLVGWVLWPVTYTDTTPELLRTDLQEDYLRMAMESFSRTGDQPTAMRRWNDLGPAAQPTLQRLLANPALVDPALAQQFAAAVQAPGVTPGAPIQGTPAAPG